MPGGGRFFIVMEKGGRDGVRNKIRSSEPDVNWK
jgi:hypothetical protein